MVVRPFAEASQHVFRLGYSIQRYGFVYMMIDLASPFKRSVLTSLPPMVGFTTLITLCGFSWGVPGFWLAAAGSLSGSAFAFLVLRALFWKRLRAWTARNERWQALEMVVVRLSRPARHVALMLTHSLRSVRRDCRCACSSAFVQFHGFIQMRSLQCDCRKVHHGS